MASIGRFRWVSKLLDDVITLENDEVLLQVMAQRGGRITNLVNLRDSREWLIGSHASSILTPALGDVYIDTDHFGWDEMLPTIDPCDYPGTPYPDMALADHGELWTAQWEVVAQSATSLHQRVHGRSLSFTFERTLELRGLTLRCDYRCVTPVDTYMLWALHPQFLAHDGTSLRFQPEPLAILDTSHGAPRARNWTGDLIVERDVQVGEDSMIYVDPTSVLSSVSLSDPDGSSLTMAWDTHSAQYLGVWADYCRYSAGRVIAIEPTNGFFDDLARAVNHRRATMFRAHESREWWVEVTLASRREVTP